MNTTTAPRTRLLNLRVPENLAQRFSALATATDRSLSFYLLKALATQIDELESVYLSEQRLIEMRAGKAQPIPLSEIASEYANVEG